MSFSDSSRQSLSFNSGSKPRLVRQSAFHDEEPSSPRLNVRFLPTIPSAPDSSVQLDEEPEDQEQPAFVNIEEKSSDTLQIPTSNREVSSPKIKSKPP